MIKLKDSEPVIMEECEYCTNRSVAYSARLLHSNACEKGYIYSIIPDRHIKECLELLGAIDSEPEHLDDCTFCQERQVRLEEIEQEILKT